MVLDNPPSIRAAATVGCKKESEGPLGGMFDIINKDSYFGQASWEKAESQMQSLAVSKALEKAGLQNTDIDFIFAGDLLNQCIGSTYGLRELGIPYVGLFGACSTMAESLCVASTFIEGGVAQKVVACTSSHFCTAERQFRFPLEYGGQRTPTAQWTATASGAAVLQNGDVPPFVRAITVGTIEDLGVTDANNMGAAMAPAAYDTLSAFFRDTKTGPRDYDLIITGDLGELGHSIVRDFFSRDGIDMGNNFQDCGLLLYDRESQDMHAGGSGCGCSASVLNGYLLSGMRQGKWKKIVFAPTGALLSPTSSFQGESIPSICHALCISTAK